MKLILDRTAVEALIGGNTEAEIEVRNSIVQAFTKRYLKDVVATDMFAKFVAEERGAAAKVFKEAVKEHIGNVVNEYGKVYLTPSPKLKEALSNHIDALISSKVTEVTESASKLLDKKIKHYLDSLDSRIERHLETIHTEVLEQKVRARFEALMAASKPE